MTRRLWLAVLALALMAPAALASAPRGASQLELVPPSLSLERALESDEPSGFALGLASLDATPQRFAPLAGVELVEDLAQDLRQAEPSYPKTRIGGLRLFGQDLYVVSTSLSVEVRWGCGDFSCGIAEGDGVNLYAFVGQRPHEATDPLGTDALYEGVQAAAQSAPALRLIIGGGGVAAAPVLSSASMYTPHGLLVLGGLLAIGTPFQIKLIDAEADAYMAEANARAQEMKLAALRRRHERQASARPGLILTEQDWESPYLTQMRSADPGSAEYQTLSRLHKNYVDITTGDRTPKAVHDEYLQYVRPGAKEATFATPWSASRGLGTRRFDDYDPVTKTGFEANTTPWNQMNEKQLKRKLDQVASDWTLRETNPDVERVVWFGTEPLPETGLGGQLRKTLKDAGIEYWVVPPK